MSTGDDDYISLHSQIGGGGGGGGGKKPNFFGCDARGGEPRGERGREEIYVMAVCCEWSRGRDQYVFSRQKGTRKWIFVLID